MPKVRTPLQQLRAIYNPAGLCRGLARVLVEQGQPCDHTFRHTRAFFAAYAPDVDVPAYIALLELAGAHCDCEVGHNVCARIGE